MKTTGPLEKSRESKLFPLGQIIFNTDEADNATYVLAAGEVAIRMGNALIDIVEAGEFLTAQMLPEAPGIVAVAKTNCRLVAVN